ncbi:MAG: hypothetical protein KIS73_19570 [Enhydrobacter sp.]|nr:hypothetical protein [Enhydrobacter sp.]
MVARHELDWARQRGGKRRTKSERVAASLIEACQALSNASRDYKPHSRFTRTLAADCRDQHGYERNIAIGRDERRRLLLDTRAHHTAALRKVLSLIDAYKAVRWPAEHRSRPEAVFTH